jgi:hypothetical protein
MSLGVTSHDVFACPKYHMPTYFKTPSLIGQAKTSATNAETGDNSATIAETGDTHLSKCRKPLGATCSRIAPQVQCATNHKTRCEHPWTLQGQRPLPSTPETNAETGDTKNNRQKPAILSYVGGDCLSVRPNGVSSPQSTTCLYCKG